MMEIIEKLIAAVEALARHAPVGSASHDLIAEARAMLPAASRPAASELSTRTLAALEGAGVAPEAAAKMSAEELSALPGIGPASVAEILGHNDKERS